MDRRRQKSLRYYVVLLLLASLALGADPVHCFTVALPGGWRKAERVMLLVKDVQVPRNRSVIFRVYLADEDSKGSLLGSFSVVGEAPDAEGTARFPVFPINITRPLSRWGETHPQDSSVKLRIVPVDGKNRALESLDWSAREVTIELQG